MVTTRRSNQQRSQSRQNAFQVLPTENIGNLSASRRRLWVILQFLLSGVLTVFQNLNNKLQKRLSDLLLHNRVIAFKTKSISRRRSHEDMLCDTLQEWHRSTLKWFIKPPYSISRAILINSDCCRLPTASVLSNKAGKTRSKQF